MRYRRLLTFKGIKPLIFEPVKAMRFYTVQSIISKGLYDFLRKYCVLKLADNECTDKNEYSGRQCNVMSFCRTF